MANHNNIDSMLTISEVAQLLNVHINTVRRWSNQGILKSYRIGSRGDRRFRQDDIDGFLAQGNNDIDRGVKKEKASFDRLDTKV